MATVNDALKNTNSDVVIVSEVNNDTMLIVFGGIAGELGMPAFEFFKSTAHFNVNKMYIRDLSQAWYSKGLSSIGNSLGEITNFLKSYIQEHSISKTVVIGNSMGGYGALLFGKLIQADRIYAFSPQTFIDKLNRFVFFDHRWRKQIRNVQSNRFLDLKKIYSKGINPKVEIHYANNQLLDKIHASRMRKFRNIKLVGHQHGGHRIIKNLRDSGELERILSKELD